MHLLEQNLYLWIFLKITLYYLFQNLICSECGDEFTLQSQLSIHMEEHRQELAGSRVHSCKSCKKEFETSSQLKEHMKTHYKIRWQSQFCNKMRRCYFEGDRKAGVAFPVSKVPWPVLVVSFLWYAALKWHWFVNPC